jgi:uncharacterized RDD family membrane protein YckC
MSALNPKRNKAFLIDFVIYVSLILTPIVLFGFLPDWLSGKAFVVGICLGLAYMVFRDGFEGQSVGKRICRIQVVNKRTRKPIGFGMALCRGILTGFPVIGWIDFLQVSFTADRQRLSDRILGLELVIVEPSNSL